jgi:excisionase family DNA binding protein
MENITPRSTVLRDALAAAKPATPESNGVFTVEETCQYLRISKWTLYRLIQTGKLKTIKIGSRRLVRVQSLREFVEQLETGPGA